MQRERERERKREKKGEMNLRSLPRKIDYYCPLAKLNSQQEVLWFFRSRIANRVHWDFLHQAHLKRAICLRRTWWWRSDENRGCFDSTHRHVSTKGTQGAGTISKTTWMVHWENSTSADWLDLPLYVYSCCELTQTASDMAPTLVCLGAPLDHVPMR